MKRIQLAAQIKNIRSRKILEITKIKSAISIKKGRCLLIWATKQHQDVCLLSVCDKNMEIGDVRKIKINKGKYMFMKK